VWRVLFQVVDNTAKRRRTGAGAPATLTAAAVASALVRTCSLYACAHARLQTCCLTRCTSPRDGTRLRNIKASYLRAGTADEEFVQLAGMDLAPLCESHYKRLQSVTKAMIDRAAKGHHEAGTISAAAGAERCALCKQKMASPRSIRYG
jgi:hypothetical protein